MREASTVPAEVPNVSGPSADLFTEDVAAIHVDASAMTMSDDKTVTNTDTNVDIASTVTNTMDAASLSRGVNPPQPVRSLDVLMS